MDVSIDISQLTVLDNFFQDLTNADQRKIFLSGFRKAAKPLISAAQANSPYRTGKLKKSIGTIAISDEIAIIVGAKKTGHPKGWHGHFFENGTAQRFRKSGGATGSILATHWFERAFDATQDQVYGSIENEWYDAIDKFIIRTNKVKK